ERPVYPIQVGPSRLYQVIFEDSATAAPITGIIVDFAKVGGIPVAPVNGQVSSSMSGVAILPFRPMSAGTVTVNLSIRKTASATPVQLIGLSLATFDYDSVRVLGLWRIG